MEQSINAAIQGYISITSSWSIASSMVSIVLAILAIAMAIYFFVLSKRTESEVSNSLTKIEAQADLLSKITGKQLDRLTKYVTEKKTSDNDPELKAIVDMMGVLTEGLTNAPTQDSGTNLSELHKYQIGIYYYTAVANFWLQKYLPSPSEFNESDSFDVVVKRLVDLSASDFLYMSNMLSSLSMDDIEASGVKHMYEEAKNDWSNKVKDSSDAFVSKSKVEQ